jgi:FkbM family methyltransferase
MSKIKMFGSHIIDFSLIPDDGIFIDAGACQGNFIDDIKKNVKNSYIFAIEPNKENYRLLNEKNYGRVMLFKNALVGSEEPRHVEFWDFSDIGLPEWGNVSELYGARKHKNYMVKTINIRELLAIIPPGPIHHLKMDIEGCEHKVIADLTEDDAKRIQQISLEVHNGLQQMEDRLKKLGYNTQFENGELYGVRKELG